LPEDINNLLQEALNWKKEDERDEILDDCIDIIQNSDNTDIDLRNNLNDLTWNMVQNDIEQTENSTEQKNLKQI
jgi:hypothetical protein